MPTPLITTARTARLDLPHLFPGQAQKEAFVNEALARLDTLVQAAVIDERANPPADPAPGDCYIVGDAPTGAWSGHANAIAGWAENQWLFATPGEGWRAFDRSAGSVACYRGAAGWVRATAPALPTGGNAPDAEARAALSAVIASLKELGIFA